MPIEYKPDEESVFINVPFDKSFERSFVALIASLISIGRKPRCVLELPEYGEGRLNRIFKHLKTCRVSIHDLSRVGLPVRFNMPFELGLACALARYEGSHSYIIFEKKRHRLSQTLSDISRCDPQIHKGSMISMINCVLDTLASRRNNPDPNEVHRMSINLWRVTCEMKRRTRRDSIYNRSLFLRIVEAGIQLSREKGFIV